MTIGFILLTVTGLLILFGVGQRVLDRLHLTDVQAIVFIALIIAGGFVPDIPVTNRFAFNIGGGHSYIQQFDWRDTVRVGFGMEYDFLDWLTGRIGYTFDEDPTKKHHESTMLPAGDRHIIGMGVGFKLTENLRLDLAYNFIRMNNEHYYVTYEAAPGVTQKKRMSCCNGSSHLVSATVSYAF